MKKIFAILISFLFIVSTIGIVCATTENPPPPPNCCSPSNFDISTTSVKVGETFTTYYFTWGCTPTNLNEAEGLIEKIRVDVYINGQLSGSYDPKIQMPPSCPNCWFDVTYRAVKPGTVVFSVPACGNKTVTISSRALPMDKFMKFFGFGKEKKD